jgi:hypothetical protein
MIHVKLFIGDELLSINSKALHGMTHAEAIAEFKAIKIGDIVLHVGRYIHTLRSKRKSTILSSNNSKNFMNVRRQH